MKHSSPRKQKFGNFGRSQSAGLTLVEMLIVIVLFATSAVLLIPFTGRSLSGRHMGADAEIVTDSLRQAQNDAMSSKGDGSFGVHFESDNFVYFIGSVYSPIDTTNVIHELYGDVSLSHSLGGGDDVIFDNHRGLPSATGTVTVTAEGGQNQVITIGSAGKIGR